MKMDGCMEDGSCQSFFPHGFSGHIYSETLLNRDLDYDKEFEDYYSHLYGEDWKEAYDYLKEISDAFDFAYLVGECCKDEKMGPYFDPERVENMDRVIAAARAMREKIGDRVRTPIRPVSTAWRVLSRHTEWCEGLALCIKEKCLGKTDKAMETFTEFFKKFGAYDYELESFFDLQLAHRAIWPLIKKKYPGEETY
jgi:hypothetical protein